MLNSGLRLGAMLRLQIQGWQSTWVARRRIFLAVAQREAVCNLSHRNERRFVKVKQCICRTGTRRVRDRLLVIRPAVATTLRLGAILDGFRPMAAQRTLQVLRSGTQLNRPVFLGMSDRFGR